MKLPSASFISRLRRIHALEHATVHVLTQHYPYLTLLARSDWHGFSLHGHVATWQVEEAVKEALARLRAGERHLALHPRCGTMMAVSGLLSGLAAFAALQIGPQSGGRARLAALPNAVLAATAASLVAQPIGMLVQRYVTTTCRPDDLRVLSVRRRFSLPLPVHRVEIG